MVIQLADWQFRVDREATIKHTTKNSHDHCECGYCRNYYAAVDVTYPNLRPFLEQFGVVLEGPSELMPFEPTYMLACYRVQGYIQNWGRSEFYVDNVPVCIEASKDDTFLLWIGELALPWVLEEAVEDVISPANTPEFMERMLDVWIQRHGPETITS